MTFPRAKTFGVCPAILAVACCTVLALTLPVGAVDSSPANPASKAAKPGTSDTTAAKSAEAPLQIKIPRSVDVQIYVIMASRGEVEDVDPALKELAELLKTKFKNLYNRFRLHKSSQTAIKKDTTSTFSLVSDYTLWATYENVRVGHTSSHEKVVLNLRITKSEEVIDDKGNKKKQEVEVVVPIRTSVEREKFLLFGGLQVGDETMFLAIRVLK